MDWIDTMPDEAFKALILGGVGMCVLAGLVWARSESAGARRVFQCMLGIGGVGFAVGLLIAAIRESDKLSHTTIVAFAIGVLTTTLLYIAWVISASPRLLRAASITAVLTLMSATLMALTVDTDDCSPSETTDSAGNSEIRC